MRADRTDRMSPLEAWIYIESYSVICRACSLHMAEDQFGQVVRFAFCFLRDSIWWGRKRIYVAYLDVAPSGGAMMYELELVEELARVADEEGYGPLQGRGTIA